MSKRTAGHKLAREFWDKCLDTEAHAKRIDAAIRREKTKAWGECCEWSSAPDSKAANPYRGREKQ